MVENSLEVVHDVLPFLKVYKDGTVQRLAGTGVAPATFDPKTGVSSEDIVVIKETGVSVRLYHPTFSTDGKASAEKLPLVVYIHGGAFFISSAKDPNYHFSLNALVSKAKVILVSVDYRLAPENPLPAAYEDSWAVLKWLDSIKNRAPTGVQPGSSEEFLKRYADFEHVFLAGDSAGANMSHHLAIKAAETRQTHDALGVKISGILMIHPYFWGEEAVGVETTDPMRKGMVENWWKFVCPSDKGCDDPLINFLAEGGAEKLANLACDRVIVCVAEKDILRDRGRLYYETLEKSKWGGKVELFETKGEDHVFHIFDHSSENAAQLIKALAFFINQGPEFV